MIIIRNKMLSILHISNDIMSLGNKVDIYTDLLFRKFHFKCHNLKIKLNLIRFVSYINMTNRLLHNKMYNL